MNNIKLQGIDVDGIEKEYSLNDFRGQKVILYFYPKDNTSGCTQEACDFRDNINRLTSFATVIGVSPDSIKSHLKFKEKQSLNFILLSDPEHKLAELKQTAKDKSKIDEMQVIVDEMIRDRENRIDTSLARFTDSRLKPGVRETKDGYLPVLGASSNVSVAYTEVTNEEYARFINATGRKAPSNWTNGTYPSGKAKYPVTNVSYNDAVAYCNWLSKNDSSANYRLPTEKEWEQAAGHMPEDADFNAGENKGIVPVTSYSGTLSASGAINMWGNVWEWTSTSRDNGTKTIKGGAWDSKRTDCRTENRTQGKNPNNAYNNVGFRIIRVK